MSIVCLKCLSWAHFLSHIFQPGGIYATAMLKITMWVIVFPFSLRGCTDIICCVLFIVVILGYMAVGILGKMGLLRTSHLSLSPSHIFSHTHLLILYVLLYFFFSLSLSLFRSFFLSHY